MCFLLYFEIALLLLFYARFTLTCVTQSIEISRDVFSDSLINLATVNLFARLGYDILYGYIWKPCPEMDAKQFIPEKSCDSSQTE